MSPFTPRRAEGFSNVRTWFTAVVAFAILLAGCESTDKDSKLPVISASGKSAADRGTVFLKVFLDDDVRAKAPVDMQIKIDDKPVINRSFSFGPSSDDGQYQITLPTGSHTLSATSLRGKTQISRRFRVGRGDKKFIELYVTDQGRVKLTPQSKIRILKFVIKHRRKPQQKSFNPAMWMRLSAHRTDPGQPAARRNEPACRLTFRTGAARNQRPDQWGERMSDNGKSMAGEVELETVESAPSSWQRTWRDRRREGY